MNSEPPKPRHNRKLVLSGIALTRARNPKDDVRALSEVRDELERELIAADFFQGAPFSWIGLSIRFGIKTEVAPHFQPICKKDGELPLAIEIETAQMQGVGLEQLKALFRAATLRALLCAASRYNRPNGRLRELQNTLPPTPDSGPL